MSASSPNPNQAQTPLFFVPGLSPAIPDNYDLRFTNLAGQEVHVDYNLLAGTLGDCGFQLTIVQPDWGGTEPSRWVEDTVAAMRWMTVPDEGIVVGGFSLGALVAAQTAEKLAAMQQDGPRVLGVMAVSLTSVFGEYIPKIQQQSPGELEALTRPGPDGRPYLHPNALTELTATRLPELSCPVQNYFGTDEVKSIKEVVRAAHAQWPRSELIPVQGGEHEVVSASNLAAYRAHVARLRRG